jgi:hypothetical protein
VWFLEELHTEGVDSTQYTGALPGFGSKISSSTTLAGSEAERVVEHRMCVKLQGVALAVLMVIREDFYTTLRSATEYDCINHVLAEC